VNKTVLERKNPPSGAKVKSKYSREIDRNEEDEEFIFSDDE
jgi:hypothetical protein